MRHRRTNATSLIVIVASFVRRPEPARTDWAYLRCGIRLLPVSGGAIRRNRCGRGALRPTARAKPPRPGCRSIGPRGRARPHAGRRPQIVRRRAPHGRTDHSQRLDTDRAIGIEIIRAVEIHRIDVMRGHGERQPSLRLKNVPSHKGISRDKARPTMAAPRPAEPWHLAACPARSRVLRATGPWFQSPTI
jgi:hypothetical protein